MGVTESLSHNLPQKNHLKELNNNNARWLVVDFDGTATQRDTTPLLPQLAAILEDDNSMEQRLSTFSQLEEEYFRLYSETKEKMCHRTQSLVAALDSLDQVSNRITAQVSASGVLRGLCASAQDVGQVLERHKGVGHHARLRPDCAPVLAKAVHARGWKLGVLSINWCPSLIEAALVQPIWRHVEIIQQQQKGTQQPQEVPIWSNQVNHEGVVSLQVPGARAKRDRISQLQSSVLPQRAFVIYVGDSSTDLAALVEADIGILIVGPTKKSSTASMAQQWGIQMFQLSYDGWRIQIAQTLGKTSSNVIWTAESWSEIDHFLNQLDDDDANVPP